MIRSSNHRFQGAAVRCSRKRAPLALTTLLALTVLTGCSSSSLFTFSPAGDQHTLNGIVLQASRTELVIGESTTLKATQDGAVVTGGKWQVVGGVTNGTIDSSGLYHTPALLPATDQVAVSYTDKGIVRSQFLTVQNAGPIITSAVPSVLTSKSTLVAMVGTGFVPETVLNVNGVAVPTLYVSRTKLCATINLPAGATGVALMTAKNPGSAGGAGTAFSIPINIPTFAVAPATLHGGAVTLTLTGPNISSTPLVTMDGKQLRTQVISPSTLVATGYLPPWRSGTTTIAVAAASGNGTSANVTVPIAATAVSYDVASRFATQAAFGPRHDIIEHIQQIGLSAFITEQMQQPPLPYDPTNGGGPRWVFLNNASSGNSLLRARVSWAFQSFIVQQGLYLTPTLIPWQHKMEVDAFGNFEQVLQDAAADTSMGIFLNLVGNAASSDPTIHPNQNFARELMQLFSIGDVMLNDDGTVQLDSTGTPIPSYDQTTVLNMSRVFTGWECDRTPDPYEAPFGCNYARPLVANESEHDHGQKTLFRTVILPAGQNAATDRTLALNAVFNHPNVPAYVSRILIQRLVKSNPSPAYVSRISAVFKNDGTGVRGNLAAVIRAILLAPEARAGDTAPTASDGFLQEPLLFEAYGMSLLGMTQTDGEPTYVPGELGEDYDYSPTVFGYYSPTYNIPGTQTNSPEFTLLNNLSLVQRSQFWWGMVQGSIAGFNKQPNYLYSTFTNIPDMVDALNHMLYHGQMSATEQAAIMNYCSGMDPKNTSAQLDIAVFLAGNGDSYNVSH